MIDRAAVERVLIADRDATRARIAAMSAELDAVAAAAAGSNIDDEHDPEGATLAFEREQLAALRAQAQARLAEVQAALDRLAGGGYGRCESCGRPIGEDRLAARPMARLCVACAARGVGRR